MSIITEETKKSGAHLSVIYSYIHVYSVLIPISIITEETKKRKKSGAHLSVIYSYIHVYGVLNRERCPKRNTHTVCAN